MSYLYFYGEQNTGVFHEYIWFARLCRDKITKKTDPGLSVLWWLVLRHITQWITSKQNCQNRPYLFNLDTTILSWNYLFMLANICAYKPLSWVFFRVSHSAVVLNRAIVLLTLNALLWSFNPFHSRRQPTEMYYVYVFRWYNWHQGNKGVVVVMSGNNSAHVLSGPQIERQNGCVNGFLYTNASSTYYCKRF